MQHFTDEYAISVLIASTLAMLLTWYFFSGQKMRLLKSLVLKALPACGIFSIAWLIEKLVGNFGYSWLAIVIIAPILEECARYVYTEILELQHQHEGLFLGFSIGIIETILIIFGIGLSSANLFFRIVFSQPLHATMGICLVSGKNSLLKNIVVHFFFNYGIFVGGIPGTIMAATALTTNIARIIFSNSTTNTQSE
jgi:hypothetical protein